MDASGSMPAEALDLLDVGVGLFDGRGRLAYCNSAFLRLRNYPADVCRPGTTLEALLRFNAERGDFGPGAAEAQVAERLAEIDETAGREVEREMADGQVLRIRYRRTGSGDLLVTYEDRTGEARARAALAASEQRYALVADAAEEAIYEWDIAADRFYASPRLKAFLGGAWSEDGARTRGWEDLVHPEDRERYRAALERHLAGADARWTCEYRIADAEGAWRWVSDHGTSIRDADGRAVRMVAALRDITERLEKDIALAASEERHTLVAPATSDGIYDWNVADDVLYVSDNLTRILDFDPGEMGSRVWAARVHPDDFPPYLAAIRAHFKGETDAVECEYRIRARGGGYRWVHDRGVGVRASTGRVTRLVGAVRDITDIREAREELGRTEARLAGALATISDGILLVDPDDRVQLWNDRYYEIFSEAAGGADLSQVITRGRPFFEMIREGYRLGMFRPHPDGEDAWVARRRRAWEQEVGRWELELANGAWILLNERRMPNGGHVSVYTDITELKRREQEATAARERFEEAIEAISSGFTLWDAEDRLITCNSRYRDYFADLADMVTPGTPFADVLRAAIARGLFPGREHDVEGFLTEILAKRNRTSGEPREQHLASGMWLRITDHRTAEGGIVSIYTDVTELKEKQTQIEAQSAILELTLENMGQGITMVDRHLNTVAFNSKFFELMELPRERFGQGFSMEEAFRYNAERGEYGPGDIEEQVRQRLELARQFQPHRFERTRPDGTVLEIAGNPIEGGGFVSTYTDITERKRAEREVREREAALKAALAEFDAVLENIDYGVLFMGPDLRARICNRAFGRIWNIPQEFIAGQPTMRELIEQNRDTGLYDVGPEDWEAWVEDRVRQVRAGDVPPGEFRRGDGRVLTYQCVALPDGGRMLTYFDITGIKEREAEMERAKEAAESALADLQRAQQRLVQAEKMASLGQLTAGIAHEIKNPLNFVNNFARLSQELADELEELIEAPMAALADEAREDAEGLFRTVRENLEKIEQHGRRADSIVRNMLQHAREGPSERQRVNLNAIAEEALNLAYHGARAEHPGFNIEMVRTLGPDVGEIECYPQDLMRVFLNLISNGMYAADRRRAEADDGFQPTIALSTRASGDGVEIEVRDNGVGIPPELKERVFVPFFTTKPAGEGTGLGLSLSYDIVVKQHGGTFDLESEPGAFTSFVVTLPRTLPADAEARA